MKQKTLFVLGFLFFFGEMKPIEPLTIFVGTFTALVAFFKKTKTGGVVAKYAQLKIAQSSAGKALVSYSENWIKALVRQRMQKHRDMVALFVQKRMEIMRGHAEAATPPVVKAFRDDVSQKIMGATRAATASVLVSSKNLEERMERFVGSKQEVNAHVVQNNIHVNQGAFSSFTYNDPCLMQEYTAASFRQHGKKQFWKGAFFGAGTIAYMDRRKKHEESRFCEPNYLSDINIPTK